MGCRASLTAAVLNVRRMGMRCGRAPPGCPRAGRTIPPSRPATPRALYRFFLRLSRLAVVRPELHGRGRAFLRCPCYTLYVPVASMIIHSTLYTSLLPSLLHYNSTRLRYCTIASGREGDRCPPIQKTFTLFVGVPKTPVEYARETGDHVRDGLSEALS